MENGPVVPCRQPSPMVAADQDETAKVGEAAVDVI